MLLSEGQMSDHKGAALMLEALPRAHVLIGDRGYDSRAFRDALAARGTAACIPSSRSRKVPIPHDPAIYRRRHKVENLFARFKDLAAHRSPLRPVHPRRSIFYAASAFSTAA